MPEEVENQDQEESTEESAQDRNWRQMQEKLEALESRVQELEPLERDKLIRDAGFDPDTDKGKAVKYAIAAQETPPASAEDLQSFVLTEFGWKPSAQLNSEESKRQQSQERINAIRTESESEEPPDEDSALIEAEQKAISLGDSDEARQAWAEVGMAKMDKVFESMGE